MIGSRVFSLMPPHALVQQRPKKEEAEILFCGVFVRVKFNFLSQNLSIEYIFFHSDVKATKIHRIWKKVISK